MLDARAQIVEILAKPDFAHDVEAEEHRPRCRVERLAEIRVGLRREQIDFGLDA